MTQGGGGRFLEGFQAHFEVYPDQLYSYILAPMDLPTSNVSVSTLMVPVGTTCRFGNLSEFRALGRIILRNWIPLVVITCGLTRYPAKQSITGP